jgi:D-arabinose 1-dehydrogenase-like Zn-dependent alcohol dehydrogenase
VPYVCQEEMARSLGADDYVISTDAAAMAAGGEDPQIDVLIVTINQTSNPSEVKQKSIILSQERRLSWI